MLRITISVSVSLFVIFAVIVTAKAQSGGKEVNSNSRIEYFEVNSPSLNSLEKVKVGVYLPAVYDSSKADLPVIYYLVGFGQDETSWEKMGVKSILDESIAKKSVLPVMVVFPGSKDTGWLNWFDGKNQWETFITGDLVNVIDEKYRTSAKPCMRAISGNSMGGLGALKIGLERYDIFGSTSAHSAAIQPENPADLPDWAKNWDGWEGRMGKPINIEFWKKENPLYLAQNLPKKQLDKQAIYFDVGDKDHLGFAKTNVLLSEVLNKRNISHTFVLRDGGHGSKFVQDNAKFALESHDKVFRQKCKVQ